MKIKIGDNIFIQKKDFLRIVHHYKYPQAMTEPYLVKGTLSINRGIINDMFIYEFSNKAVYEWIESQDWILDFDELNRLSIPDIQKLIEEKRSKIIEKVRSGKYLDNDKLLTEDNYKLSSLCDLIKYKKERMLYILPDGYIPSL